METSICAAPSAPGATTASPPDSLPGVGAGVGHQPRSVGDLKRPSRLDLLDDTQLTSLPLAPPPPPHPVVSAPVIRDRASTAGSSGVGSADDDDTLSVNDTFDDVGDDSQLVLVEDYISTVPSIPRKHSLAVFVSQLVEDDRVDISTKRRLSARPAGAGAGGEPLTAIFGDIPATSELKYCDLCVKPLYEVSSLAQRRHQQFVCGECIETYEEFAHGWGDHCTISHPPFPFEKSASVNDVTPKASKATPRPWHAASCSDLCQVKPPHVRLVEIFSTIDQKYTPAKRARFSDGLVSRLSQLQQLPSRPRPSKWSWRQSST
ncbi:hypothetical protein DIURU_002682 [Diutina rugosa]|uniref:Uncharacterized protein n=1 Tax=Diutina rugosa TaxID=5481 RepID=A0A642UTT8_DIURU|nr:uncharacterized protein DIURU_002682 [Diutina rugosa]KAA8902786.1 hypothetical protein DIURU_002682 [Diutina rugosa]